jgi:kynurenine formamidase
MTATATSIPTYRELWRDDMRGGVSWGVFGEDDQLGTLNFITAEKRVAAASMVKEGKVFPLALPQNFFEPPLTATRGNAKQHLLIGEISLDDKYDDFYPQASSQWDALKHYSHPKYGFYNGNARQRILDEPELLAIGRIAEQGVVTRGVLLDLARYRENIGRPVDPRTDATYELSDIQGCLAAQSITLQPGDMVLARTGWLDYWKREGAAKFVGPEPPKCPGLLNDHSIAEYLWDNRVAAIAGDNRALEASPGPGGRTLHIFLMTFLGMQVGEFWDLDPLAEHCAADGRYEFLLASAPMSLPGGCGSPANALAIK